LKGSVFLLRPDLHIAWRGRGYPEGAWDIARLATGHGAGYDA